MVQYSGFDLGCPRMALIFTKLYCFFVFIGVIRGYGSCSGMGKFKSVFLNGEDIHGVWFEFQDVGCVWLEVEGFYQPDIRRDSEFLGNIAVVEDKE